MQHITHIFIGKDLSSFRDQFATTFRKLHPDFESSFFSALLLKKSEDGGYILSPDEAGDSLDAASIDKDNKQNSLRNFFDDMYRRKVTVAHPGNRSLIIVLWAKLYIDDCYEQIVDLVNAIRLCGSNIQIEVAGFTHDAVSCFIANPLDRLSPDLYRSNFDSNIRRLSESRSFLNAFRLIANCNMDGVSLDLNQEAMARICAEHAALLCQHYLSIHPTVIESDEVPFESFGVSSIIFDIDYFKAYIKNRIIIDKMIAQGVDNHSFNINALAQTTNPIVQNIISQIHQFNSKKAAAAKAGLTSSKGAFTITGVVANIDKDVKNIVDSLADQINKLLTQGKISIFESEALLSLFLGEDSEMFDTSAVNAQEVTIDDIINDSATFFMGLDVDKSVLKEVSQDDIKKIRKSMRNIAVANRNREKRLIELNQQISESISDTKHISDDGYRFGETDFKVNIKIDKEPLEHLYEPHDVKVESMDLSDQFAPIRNQGKQGSCASFAVSSVIEVLRHDRNRYSPAFLYWTAREANGETHADSGASLYDVIKGATRKGVCKEESMPYNDDNFSVAPSEAATNEALDCMLIEAKTVEPKLRDIKSALADGFPVIIAARIFDSFSDTRSGFVPHPSGSEVAEGGRTDGHGNHAMVVCGFSDKERVFVVRNSWGPEFGHNGYCYIPYSYAQQFFLQACIITKVSSSGADSHAEKKTLNFNMSDNSIEAAILQNLIAEDNYELQILAEESNNLRTDWAHNIATLGNVNNQIALVSKAKARIDQNVADENEQITQLQNDLPSKVKEYKRQRIKDLIISGMITIITWIFVYFYHTSTIPWIIAAISTLIFIILIGRYSYSWRRYRQNLRDEIQIHANIIDIYKQHKIDLDINSHICGTILRDTENYRLDLLAKFHTLKKFNASWIDVYKDTLQEKEDMSPAVPYPFVSIIRNNLLDRYYDAWSDKMIPSIHLDNIFADFSVTQDLKPIIKDNKSLNDAVVRGLKNFTMKEYIKRTRSDRWQFLPDDNTLDKVLPDLDNRAKPFSPYYKEDTPLEKYIFVDGITQDELIAIARHFTQTPNPISQTNPYAITILNTSRYSISQEN
ncbi:MAG: C1 family peptidase [Lepagella sp.]